MKNIMAFIILLSSIVIAQNNNYLTPKVVKAYKFDKTKPLRDLIPIDPAMVLRFDKLWEIPNRDDDKVPPRKIGALPKDIDPALQNFMGNSAESVSPISSWDGIPNINGVLPPDTQGDVGPNHYVQMVNLSFQIWDKQGNSLYGPADNSTLWDGFGDPWDGTNDGDPIVLYDEEADRWLFTQFSLPGGSDTYPNYMLLAISESGDPTGAWYRYGFAFNSMPDYPKFGIWNDGYYLTTVAFEGSYRGVDAVVFERDSLLAGSPNARMISFELDFTAEPYVVRMLPSDFDGNPPPAGTPNYFMYMRDDAWGYTNDHLSIWEFHTDWNVPANSTFTHSLDLATQPFDYEFNSNLPTGRSNIPQPGTTVKLNTLSNRLLFRLQYRNFGDYQTLVTNHTVDVNGSDHAGVRWYELRKSTGDWSITQQGSYSPDSEHRWMGSVAMDGFGNIGLGYSVSSSSVYPSIRYTGRKKDDALNQMTITEQELIAGGGSQTSFFSRWGDYSMMSVDPNDDATFWYTTEYIETTGEATWKTRIGSFTLGADLNLKIFLEGAYNGGSLSDSLNAKGFLPARHPYGNSPWNHFGSEKVSVVDSIPTGGNGIPDFFDNNPNIVDWILVELRTGTASSTKVQTRAAFVKSDGIVVGLDGSSPLRFGVPDGNYYIVVYHRNHLSIMSANTVFLSNSSLANYDFTTGSDKYYGTGGAVQLQ